VHLWCAKVLVDRLTQLGGVWAKAGQFSGLRGDLMREEYSDELSRCLDDLPPRDFAEIRRNVEKQLGARLEDVFEWFDETCISCATIAQVHRARLRYGVNGVKDVAVKVQHRDVERSIQRDLRLIRFFYWLTIHLMPTAYSVRVCSVYLMGVSNELNFFEEANNIERIRQNLGQHKKLRPGYVVPFNRKATRADFPKMVHRTHVNLRFDPSDPSSQMLPGTIIGRIGNTDRFKVSYYSGNFDMERSLKDLELRGDPLYVDVIIPRVVQRYTTRRLIVMSFEDGIVSKLVQKEQSWDEERHDQVLHQTSMIGRAFVSQTLIDTFAHGDPHPGNILFTKSDRPVIIDFGLCMKLDPEVVKGWCMVVYGATQMSIDAMTEGFRLLGFRYLPSRPGNEREQMIELAQSLFPRSSNTASPKEFKLDDLDRRAVVQNIFEHLNVSYDLLFILRITNYTGNLIKRFDLRLALGAYPDFAQKALLKHGWIQHL